MRSAPLVEREMATAKKTFEEKEKGLKGRTI